MRHKIYLKSPGEKPPVRPDPGWVVHLDEAGPQPGLPLHHNLASLPRDPSPQAQAFLMLALGVWAADKLLPRAAAPDAWTREIALHYPAPPTWGGLASEVAGLLRFLTGDDWQLKPRSGPVKLTGGAPWPHSWQPDAVALFSGGLDSLVGAIDHLEAGKRLLLVSHYDFGQLASLQQGLAARLKSHYGPDRLAHLALRVQFPQSPELTLRSRSLLYLALGLAGAAAFDPEMPLLVPENGWISLNPPLTLNRLGPYSTRTTHPYFLHRLTDILRRAGLKHPLINPYQNLTKGEMLAGCKNVPLLQELYPLTVSCARPVASRWRGAGPGPCGYCYPCLVRRAALHRLGWDRGEDYFLDVLAGPETLRHRVRGADLRAVLLGLKTWETAPQEVWGRLWLGEPSTENHALAHKLLTQGFLEMARFFRDKGPEWINAYLC